MRGKADTNRAIFVALAAWLAALVLPLVLVGLVLAVKAAHAAPAGPAIVPLAFEEEFEAEEEGELEEGECSEAEEEFGEGELSEGELEEICEEEEEARTARAPGVAPPKCLLRSAQARVAAYPSRNRVRVTIGYTTYEPTAASVDYGLEGGRGSLRIDTAKRHLGRSGVLRLTKSLSKRQMAKVQAAGHFTVRVRVGEAPGDCRRYETEQLTVKRASKRRAVWFQAS